MKYIGFQNGIFLAQDEMHISIHDRGYLYGETIFETCLWIDGICEYFDEHWDRWQFGMKRMKLICPHGKDAFQKIIQGVIEKNAVSEGIIRWTASYDQSQKQTNICITVRKYISNPKHYDEGISLLISDVAKPHMQSFVHCKHGNYLFNMQEFRKAQAHGYDDVLFLNAAGFIAETAIANIFWKKDRVLYTPSIDIGILPGIMRQKVLEQTCLEGVFVQEGEFEIEQILQADEVFVTNCVQKILPVKQIVFYSKSFQYKV